MDAPTKTDFFGGLVHAIVVMVFAMFFAGICGAIASVALVAGLLHGSMALLRAVRPDRGTSTAAKAPLASPGITLAPAVAGLAAAVG